MSAGFFSVRRYDNSILTIGGNMKFANSRINVLAVSLSLIFIQAASSSAQITINIPKFPKIKKEMTQTSVHKEAVNTDPKNPAASSSMDCERGATLVHLEDLEKTRKEAEGFRPGQREYFVSTLSHSKNIYLEAALLPSMRKQFLDSRGSPDFTNCMNPALDRLAQVARRTIPSYTGPTTYTFGTPAEKKILANAITDIAQAKVLKAGMRQANWLIEKDNFNFPTARYKHGVVVAQYPNSEFCWVFWVNLVQSYSGGGTYGASYGNYVGRSLAGCPVAK
jgi:hypothetical protein